MLNKPQLPPRVGYVEVEISGERVYEPTPEMVAKAQSEELIKAENSLLKAQLKATAERQDFLEDCIAEMAAQVYE